MYQIQAADQTVHRLKLRSKFLIMMQFHIDAAPNAVICDILLQWSCPLLQALSRKLIMHEKQELDHHLTAN